MSEHEKRKLERVMRRDGTLGDFILSALEDLDVDTLFKVQEASERALLAKAGGKETPEADVEQPEHTQRGFVRSGFTDLYGEKCSIQMSSLATRAAIWLGVDTPDLMVFAPAGAGCSFSLEFQNGEAGWANAKVQVDGGNVLQSGRMHLSQRLVRDLLPRLQHFAEHGELPGPPPESRM